MEQFIYGTSAADAPCADGARWRLRKTGGADRLSCYELHTDGAADADAPGVMLNVIRGLLDGMHVGVIAEGGASGALSGLGKVWREGRMLKRRESSAFVALGHTVGEIPRDGVEACARAGGAFRFMGFDGSVPGDTVFRNLTEGDDSDSAALSCCDLADGVLSIRLDAEKIDENAVLGEISDTIGSCGRFLQVEL